MKKQNLYMIFLFVLSFIILINSNVSAKTYANFSVRDIVTLSKGSDLNKTWRVIENSDKNSSTVKLFSENNVKGGTQYDPYGRTNYNTAAIKSVVNNYGDSLNLGSDLIEIRLITLQELKSLGCSSSSCTSAPSWVYSTSYWTQTATSNNLIYRVGNAGTLLGAGTRDTYYGVRPVLVVSKDAVLNGYTNDEKNFEDINIECTNNLKSKDDFKCKFKIDKTVKKITFDFEIESNGIIENYKINTSNWNEVFPTVQENNSVYKYENIQLNNKIDLNNDILFELSGRIKKITEDSNIKLKLTNIKMYDELGDYQNINSIEKEIKVKKEQVNTQTKEEIKNPKTGISSKIGIFMIIIGLGIIAYLTVQRYSKNY